MIGLAIFILGVTLVRLMGAGSGDGRRTWSGRSGRWLLAWLLAGPLWLGCLFALLRGLVSPMTVGLGLATTLVLFPWPLTRAVLIPLGLVRSSYWLTRLADLTWGRDPVGGAAVAAVLAASRGRHPATTAAGRLWQRLVVRPSDLAYARERIQRLDLLGAAGATAAVLLADLDDDEAGPKAGGGDEGRGDALAAATAWFDPEVVPGAAARLLAERALFRIGPGPGRRAGIMALAARGSPTVRFIQAVLRRDDDDSLIARLECAWWWLLAPRRRRTWPLLRGTQRVLAATTDDASSTTRVATTPTGEGLAGAARRHLELRGRGAATLVDVVELASWWEATLPGAVGHLQQRAATLKVDGEQVARELRATVLGSLRLHVEPLDLSTVDLKVLPPLLQAVVAEVRSERLDALEIAVAAWRQRLEAGIERAPIDELREWTALRTLAGAVARTGVDGRYLAFEAAQWVTCELAVHLWNVRREHRLANAIFRSLLDEARALGDTRAEETQKANVACGP